MSLYYYGDVTMKDIGVELGVNESRVSQLHARAIQRLRQALGTTETPKSASNIIREAVAAFQQKPRMLKAQLATQPAFASATEDEKDPMVASWTRMPLAMAAEKPRRGASRKPVHQKQSA